MRKLLANKTLIALVGAVVGPLGALLYLANTPGGGRGSGLAVALQVGLVVSSVILFAVFLAKLVEQMNAGRVRRWLATDEGRDWLADLSEEERAEFLDRLDGAGSTAIDPEPDEPGGESPVDSSEPSR